MGNVYDAPILIFNPHMHPQLLFGPSRFQIQPEVEVEVRLQARMRDHILQNIKNVNFWRNS